MSYLLTEIALEMLGYKYYDVDGAFGPTNFQNNPDGLVDQGATEPLQKILGLSQTDKTEANTASLTNGGGTQISQAAVTTEQIDLSQDDMEVDGDEKHSKSSAAPDNKVRPTPSEISKLLEMEADKIREQLRRKTLHYVQSNMELAKRIERGGLTAQDFLQPFVEQERKKLQAEVQNMRNFRKFVEEGVVKINQDVYQRYSRRFRHQHSTAAKEPDAVRKDTGQTK